MPEAENECDVNDCHGPREVAVNGLYMVCDEHASPGKYRFAFFDDGTISAIEKK